MTDPPAYKNLWREYQAALSQAEAAARLQVSTLPSDASAPIAIEEGDTVSESPKKERHSEPCIEPEEPTPFSGGKMVFFPDRVKLCGVTICYGKRSQTKRTILDLLRKKQSNGRFASYSGEELAEQARLAGGDSSASGAIRDLRDDLTKLLLEKANIDCGREDVILSGGRGYRFADCITVQDGDQPEIADITDMGDASDVPNVPDQDVPNVHNEDTSDDAARKRRAWILQRLDESQELQAPAVAKHFKCSVKTAHRDLQALKDEGLIEFVGVPRTGHYRLRNPSEADE